MSLLNRLRLWLGLRNGYDVEGTPSDIPYWIGGREIRQWIDLLFKPELRGTWRTVYRYHQKHLVYVKDETKFGVKEYWQPAQMYQENKHMGDCEDSAVWLVSIFIQSGYNARLVVGFMGDYWKRKKRQPGEINHAWVAVWDPKRSPSYPALILETTSKTARPIRTDVPLNYIPVVSCDKTTIWRHNG